MSKIMSFWKPWRKITRTALLGMLCLILVPAVCAGQKVTVRAKHKIPPPPPVDPSKLVWPLPPQIARIRYIQEAIGQRDVEGIKKKKAGWLERVAGVTVQNEELPRLKKPYGVAVDSKGLIYVADEAQQKVLVFDLEKKHLAFRGDKAPAHFQLAIGVAIDDKDRLFVSDSVLHQVTCFDAKGDFLSVFGSEKLLRPVGMAVDNDLRRLYVADIQGARLAIFDLDTYQFVRYINSQAPSKEEPHGFLGTPTNVAVDPDGLVYVVDTIPNRVEVFDTDGNYVRGFGEQGRRAGNFARPKGIAVDSDGHIYVADNEFNTFQVFTPEGQPLLAVGHFGPQPGEFMLLTGLVFDNQNRLVATDAGPIPRIEVFRYVTDAEAKLAEEKMAKGEGEKSGSKSEAMKAPQ